MNTQSIRHFRFVAALVIALASLTIGLLPTSVFAQGTNAPTNTFEIYGAITANQNGAITVAGFAFPTTGAQINAPLTVGTLVEVEGSLLANGSFAVREVNTPDAGDDNLLAAGSLELVGTLNQFSAGAAVINGLTFSLAGAEIQSGLAVGNLVKVEALRAANGTWAAWELKAAEAMILPVAAMTAAAMIAATTTVVTITART